jgi:DNA polymerase/3'-5' exonuclease PolX
MSTTMNTSNMLTEIKNMINENEYLTDLCKEQARKIEELKQLIRKADEERISKLLEESIQKVGAVLNEAEKPSLFETTARTKTFTLNQEIAEHLKELGEMTSDFYKTATYERAAEIIATLDYEVHNGDSLLKIDGIGKGIASKVNQFLDEYFEDSESVASNDPESDDEDVNNFSEDEESDTDDEDYFVSHNEELTEALDSLAYFEEDPHKAAAYDNAAYAVQHLPFKITSGDELVKGPKKVKGIGKGIAKKIDEFIETGKIEKLEKYMKSYPDDSDDEDFFAVLTMNVPLVAHIHKLAHEEEDHFKSMAYKKAAQAIDLLNFTVTNGKELSEGPKKVKGIGKSIAKKIDNFLAPRNKISVELESNPVSTNEEIAWHLEVLASLEAEDHGSQDPHKVRAYRDAAQAIRGLDFEVTNGSDISQGPSKVKGIGKSIAAKIDELIVTGKIQRIRDLSE